MLAGTFAALAVLPLVVPDRDRLHVAFGVLLDTFIVRSVLVPALVLDIGAASGGRRACGARGLSGPRAPARGAAGGPAADHAVACPGEARP